MSHWVFCCFWAWEFRLPPLFPCHQTTEYPLDLPLTYISSNQAESIQSVLFPFYNFLKIVLCSVWEYYYANWISLRLGYWRNSSLHGQFVTQIEVALIMDSFSMAKYQSQCGSPIVSANSGEIIILDTLAEGFIDVNQTLILTPEPSFDL